MPRISFSAAGVVALLAALLYQTVFREIVIKLGVGRTIQPITDFPYECRRIEHEELQACEDMWLDEHDRRLYLACSNVVARHAWIPNTGKLDAEKRYMKDAIYVLDIDKPVGQSYGYQPLDISPFYGTAGEGSLHLLSISARRVPASSNIEFYLVNNKPSLSDPVAGTLADNTKTGANATIELFEIESGSTSMRHKRTFSHPLIVGPNNIAPIPDGSGFYITNDHGLHKTGLKHSLSPFLSTGNVVHCTNPPLTSTTPPTCKVVATGLSFPNGLTIHPLDPKTLYVPSAALGRGVAIYKIHSDGSLTKLHDLVVPYPMDNLSPSVDGSIYAAAFPSLSEGLKYLAAPDIDPTIAAVDRKSPPATVLKIDKLRNLVNDGNEVTWTWDKVLEDAEGLALPFTTTAARDATTGRMFMSGKKPPVILALYTVSHVLAAKLRLSAVVAFG